MNASFRTVSLESHIPEKPNPEQSNTVSRSENAYHQYDEDGSAQESSQRLLPHRLGTEQGDDVAQGPQRGQLASSTSSSSPTPSRFSYDSLERFPTSEIHLPPEANDLRGQDSPNICGRFFSIWTTEILSCAIASLCLAAIVGILSTHQGLPLPQWPLNITINALVSVFTAIFKMALMVPVADGISQFKWLWFDRPRELADIERLDQASRGAWGSFVLLFSRVPRLDAIWLANLGALITVAALAVDPFSQQIIQSEPCLQNITGAAAGIPKIQNFQARITTPSVKPRLTGSLQAAMYMGLLSPPPNSSVAVTADCRTGNCTFPSDDGATFSTLAMCHSCVDISHTITHNETLDDNGRTQAAIQSGAQIDGSYTMFASSAGGSSSLFEDSLFSFDALMSREINNHTDDFAIACGLTVCLKTFGATVTNGIYQERELSSIELVWSAHAGYTLATNRTLRDGTWQSCMPTPQNTTTNNMRINTTTMGLMSHVSSDGPEDAVSTNIDLENITAGASLWYPDDCVWWFGDSPAKAMSQHLNGFFNNKTLDTPYWSRGPSSAQGDLWLVSLYRNGTANMDTVNAYMDGLAWSVTANMRQTSNAADTPLALSVASGQMQALQSCLKVRWVWLSLPASLLGLQLAFLVVIVVISGSMKHWHGDWKDSSLALLYHGLEGSANMCVEKVEREELRDRDGMFKAARKLKVQLRQGKDNWRFHTVQ